MGLLAEHLGLGDWPSRSRRPSSLDAVDVWFREGGDGFPCQDVLVDVHGGGDALRYVHVAAGVRAVGQLVVDRAAVLPAGIRSGVANHGVAEREDRVGAVVGVVDAHVDPLGGEVPFRYAGERVDVAARRDRAHRLHAQPGERYVTVGSRRVPCR